MTGTYAGPISAVEHAQRLGASAEAVYAWHTRPGALERLTPPWEHVEIRQANEIAEGSRVTLRIKAGPLRWHWVARHRNIVPGRQFVDEQVSGPFAHWVHSHRFSDEADGASRILERVEFAPPFGPLGALAGPSLRRRVSRMLRYRHQVLRDDFRAGDWAAPRPLRIAVTGATGLVGCALLPALRTAGHSVQRIVRSRPTGDDIVWNVRRQELDASRLEGVDAVIHLAGENIAGARWSAEQKARIRDSRVDGTSLLARTLASLTRKPEVLVSVSASGIYGDRRDEVLTESAESGDDFLAEVAAAWEAAARPAADAGIRVVHPRLGLVLSPAGGALERLLLPANLGAGGPLGDGRQWWSWVTLDDVVAVLRQLLERSDLRGPVNVSAPHPVRNADFAKTLGRVLHRPAVLAAPAFALRAALGEMADSLLLASQRLEPAALTGARYHFRYPELEGALRHLLGHGEDTVPA